MKNKPLYIFLVILLLSLSLSGCNLPNKQDVTSPTQSTSVAPQITPTPSSLCANPLFPNSVGDQWLYTGTNSIIGNYDRTDTITSSSNASFTQGTSVGKVTYSVTYDCSTNGLTAVNPIQQYGGVLLNNPNIPVNVKLTANSGVSLPSKINPGDTWQQIADWEATSQQLNVNGRFVFDYTAVGYESITVTAGTYNALRITTTIHVELTSFHVPAGNYTIISWWVPKVGMVKSEGTSHVPGVDFTDSMQLTSFTSAP